MNSGKAGGGLYRLSMLNAALRDPRFIREFKAAHCVERFAENVTTKKKCVAPPLRFLTSLICALGRNYGEGMTNSSWSIPGRSDLQYRPTYNVETLVSCRIIGPWCTPTTVGLTGNATTHSENGFESQTWRPARAFVIPQRHGQKESSTNTGAHILLLRPMKEQIDHASLYHHKDR